MKMWQDLKSKSLFFLIGGILVLCVGFLAVSCGTGPLVKTSIEKGAFAIDFSRVPTGDIGTVYVFSSTLPNYANSELTIEAWIKRNTTSTFQGTIFARFDTNPANPNLGRGVIMYVKSNKPYFGINPSATSTFPVVSDDGAMSNNTWYHIAGVLANSVHTHSTSTSCTTTVMAQTPHIDIYVNGSFQDCATTSSAFADNPASTDTLSMGKFDPDVTIDTITDTTRYVAPGQIGSPSGMSARSRSMPEKYSS